MVVNSRVVARFNIILNWKDIAPQSATILILNVRLSKNLNNFVHIFEVKNVVDTQVFSTFRYEIYNRNK